MDWFWMFLDGWIGILIGWIITLLYMKGKLGEFPFYNRIVTWMYKAPTNNTLEKTEVFLTQVRKAIVSQILNEQVQLFSAIAKQRIILANQKRDAVAIFLSPAMFKSLLRNAFTEDIDELYEVLQDLDAPVGYLGDIPIYVSVLLTSTPVFVAGSIEWAIPE